MRLSRALATVALSGALAVGVAGTAHAEDTHNCEDFTSQKQAQNFYIAHGGPLSDPSQLDDDKDGQACDTYNYASSDRSQATTINSGIPAAPGGPAGLVGGSALVLAGAGVAYRATRRA